MLYLASTLKNNRLAASDGDIGHVSDLYFDSGEWTVRYLVVQTGAWLFGREVLIPAKALGAIDAVESLIRVNLTREKIKAAPDSDTELPFSRQDDLAFHEYYGFPPGVAPWVAFHSSAAAAFGGKPLLQTGLEDSRVSNDSAIANHGDFHLRSMHDVTGHTICGSDAEIGRVGDFLVDDRDWSIRYFIVDTAIWFGKNVVVPTAAIREVSWDERSVYLTISRERVKSAPEYHSYESLDLSFEQRLAEYYGRKTEGV